MNLPTEHVPEQIALDGPSASGKTTIGKMLAQRLGFSFLDSGLMYRAVTLIALAKSVALDDYDALARIAESAKFAVSRRGDGDWRLIVDGKDLTDVLHAEEINQNVSQISAIPGVRRALVRQQRAIADAGPIVMAGRDIGTVVLADAPLKIFLTTASEIRAQRRASDVDGNIDGQKYEEVLRSIQRRDETDSNRADSPLRPAEDAHAIDNCEISAEEVVEKILSMIVVDGAAKLSCGLAGVKAT